MRPGIVNFLNDTFGVEFFEWLVPYPALMYAVTMMACLLLIGRRSKQADLSQYHALGAAVAGMVCGLIGARLFYVLLYWGQHADLLAALFRVSGGTISWGAYTGGIIGFAGYLWIRQQPILPNLDLLGSVMGLGPFLGRWSCLLNGCDYGTVSSVPWAIEFPHGSIPFMAHVRQGLIDPLAVNSLPVHPLQIYLSLNGLLLFVIFSRLWKPRNLTPGTIFFGYWAAYAFTRFLIEFFRGNVPTQYLGIFTIGQLMTLIVFVVSVGGIFILIRTRSVVLSAPDRPH